MNITFTPSMLRSINGAIERCSRLGEIVDVYRIAEAIQTLHTEDNVAIEDIVSQIVLRAGPNTALGFLPHGAQSELVTFPPNGSQPKFLCDDVDFNTIGPISGTRH
jgi:hypothetical protein